MTDQQQLSVEATKLVKEWSTWMVVVESALIACVTRDATQLNWCFYGALGSFGVSILAAASLLSALPYVVIRLSDAPRGNIYFMSISSVAPLNRVLLWMVATIEHFAFAIGLTLFILGVVVHGHT